MDKNSHSIELIKRLESLRFLSSKEMFLLVLELCLLKYLSKRETRDKYASSYSIDDKFCFDNIIKEINRTPDIIYTLNNARIEFANSGKTDQAKKILKLVFNASREIEAFHDVRIKNQRYASAVIEIMRNIDGINGNPNVLLIQEHAAKAMGAMYGQSISLGTPKIISKFISKGNLASDVYDPLADGGFLVNTVCNDNNIKKRSLLFYNESDATISLSIAILNGCSFDDINFEICRMLETNTFDSHKYDLVVANVPANLRIDTNDLMRYSHDEQLNRFFNTGRPLFDTLVTKKVLDSLNDNGHAFLIVAGSLLSSQNQSAKQFRSLLVGSEALRGIIKIPSGALIGTTIESYIIVLDKKSNDTVFFIDSTKYFKKERAFADIDEKDAEILVKNIYNAHETISVNIDDIKNNDNKLNVSYYTDMPKLKQIVEDGNCRKLCEVANILEPELIESNSGKIIILDKLKDYPFNAEEMSTVGRSTVRIQAKDLIVHGSTQNPKVYYFQDCDEEIYAPKNSIVIRPTEIQPEYLAVYLKSEAAKGVLELVQSVKGGGKTFLRTVYINKSLIEEMPIPAPSRKSEEYIKRFNIENKYHIKYEDLLFYLNENNKKASNKPTIDGILDEELLRNVPRFKKEVFKESMDRDTKELKICYNNGAYKAATILAGSILEAILIDWVSEIYGKNFFDEPFMVEKNGREYEARLVDYIRQIRFIKQPEWLKEADEAHHIRRMRNSVHAKVSIESVINKEECNKVIEYLQDVLMSRRENP